MLNLFQKKSSSFFGVDLGTSEIKVVNLARENGALVLKNYVSLELESVLNVTKIETSVPSVNGRPQPIHSSIIESMKTVVESTGLSNQRVAMSVPTSSTFSSMITLPDMSDDELEEAVNYEARRYIPVPIEEVVFGWSVVSGKKNQANNEGATQEEGDDKKDSSKIRVNNKEIKESIKVLLIAIPKEISVKYLDIANSFNLDLIALETESFSLARSLVGKKEGVFLVIDIGYKMTSVTVVEDGLVIESHNISGVGGEEVTRVISNGFGVNNKRADLLKRENGLGSSPSSQKAREMVVPILSILVSEVRKNKEVYARLNNRPVDSIILTGGSSSMPGLLEYFKEELELPVELGDPFKNVQYDKLLEGRLKELGPTFAVAMGLALRGFENE